MADGTDGIAAHFVLVCDRSDQRIGDLKQHIRGQVIRWIRFRRRW